MFVMYVSRESCSILPRLAHLRHVNCVYIDREGETFIVRLLKTNGYSFDIFFGTENECFHVLRLLAQAIRQGEQLFEVPPKENLSYGNSREDVEITKDELHQGRSFWLKLFRRCFKRRPSQLVPPIGTPWNWSRQE